jgi:glutaredoxin
MLYSIGKFSKEIGVTTQTLRNWHKTGELIPTKVTKGGTRYYSDKQLKEYLNQIESDYPNVDFYNIDGTTIRDWCAQQNIRTVPTLFVYDNDYNIVHTQRGFNPSDEQTIKNILFSFSIGIV